ncbi:F-box domain-containing protein [Coniochaeta ligniaria NRRL 30616]|uniref:F-box domain-containing protein n=1 Tax=Coniochaeta ligniaria NRRL 30616 TaxID=1408157 RepID=A0A1J7I996_9PEZI|nr:F-box domain-containing protein [Coniochaeta ligniaria NRRL 30616]
MASNDIKSELESFREQWRAEVQSKAPGSKTRPQQTVAGPSSTQHRAQHRTQPKSQPPKPQRSSEPSGKQQSAAGNKVPQHDSDDEEYVAHSFDEPAPVASSALPSQAEASEAEIGEPVSALEHYEQAVEREAAGNLGDSLRLYRKAYRMDHRVDLQYRKKHFPQAMAPKPAPSQPNPSNAAPTVPNPAHHSSSDPPAKHKSLKELITSFAGLTIQGAPPEVEGVPPPPCPISTLPDEILVHILRDVAAADIASFVRLARVCRRLAYLVATEDQIWRRVCLGPEFGFGGMHYRWQTSVTWGPPDPEEDEAVASGPHNVDGDDETSARLQQDAQDLVPLTPAERAARDRAEKQATTLSLVRDLYSSSWQRMFRLRPRVRFGGCYISTVNYMRSGQASAHATTWHSPVHIVTYYRYLRFYRDGTVISLLTTSEPAEVVHHLTKEALVLHRGGAMAHLPSLVMQFAYKGRWRLSSGRDYPDREGGEVEGDVFIETEGVGKYLYRLDLSLKSAGKQGPRNNKLVWRGCYSYNRLTDDWAEFGQKNYKPFFFSRVRSYGIGE